MRFIIVLSNRKKQFEEDRERDLDEDNKDIDRDNGNSPESPQKAGRHTPSSSEDTPSEVLIHSHTLARRLHQTSGGKCSKGGDGAEIVAGIGAVWTRSQRSIPAEGYKPRKDQPRQCLPRPQGGWCAGCRLSQPSVCLLIFPILRHDWGAAIVPTTLVAAQEGDKEKDKEKEKEKEKEMEQMSMDERVVRVREVWVGNLAATVTEAKLYTYFFIYGEIERIDMFMFKNFAFVRFLEVASACRAYEQARGTLIDNYPIKVSYSDHIRRRNAVGDTPGYQLTPKNAKAILLQYKTATVVPPEDIIEDELCKYGRVKSIYIKQIPSNPTFKPQIFADYFMHVREQSIRRKRHRTQSSS